MAVNISELLNQIQAAGSAGLGWGSSSAEDEKLVNQYVRNHPNIEQVGPNGFRWKETNSRPATPAAPAAPPQNPNEPPAPAPTNAAMYDNSPMNAMKAQELRKAAGIDVMDTKTPVSLRAMRGY